MYLKATNSIICIFFRSVFANFMLGLPHLCTLTMQIFMYPRRYCSSRHKCRVLPTDIEDNLIRSEWPCDQKCTLCFNLHILILPFVPISLCLHMQYLEVTLMLNSFLLPAFDNLNLLTLCF